MLARFHLVLPGRFLAELFETADSKAELGQLPIGASWKSVHSYIVSRYFNQIFLWTLHRRYDSFYLGNAQERWHGL